MAGTMVMRGAAGRGNQEGKAEIPAPLLLSIGLTEAKGNRSSFSQLLFDKPSWGFALVGGLDCRLTVLFPF